MTEPELKTDQELADEHYRARRRDLTDEEIQAAQKESDAYTPPTPDEAA